MSKQDLKAPVMFENGTVMVPLMTLRDYFAGHALAGVSTQQYTHQFTAQLSYALADAMLAERAKP